MLIATKRAFSCPLDEIYTFTGLKIGVSLFNNTCGLRLNVTGRVKGAFWFLGEK
jgi:hypothetical protein